MYLYQLEIKEIIVIKEAQNVRSFFEWIFHVCNFIEEEIVILHEIFFAFCNICIFFPVFCLQKLSLVL